MQNPLKSVANFTTQMTSRFVKQPGSILKSTPISSKPWWIKISTQNPVSTYYFGPFDTRVEAVMAQFGYIEDLEQENALDITVAIDRFSPEQLTICDDYFFVSTGLV
jgi:hypothetical protein